MAERWQEVRRCAFRHEAESLRRQLQDAGLRAVVPDPGVMGMHPTCANRAPGARVLVLEDQVERARRILDTGRIAL